jgi:hypothetical protein
MYQTRFSKRTDDSTGRSQHLRVTLLPWQTGAAENAHDNATETSYPCSPLRGPHVPSRERTSASEALWPGRYLHLAGSTPRTDEYRSLLHLRSKGHITAPFNGSMRWCS